MKLSNKKKTILYIVLILLLILICIFSQILWYTFHTEEDIILPGVYVNNLYVGSMTKSEATKIVSDDLSGFLDTAKTTIVNGDKEYTIFVSDIANIDVNSLVEQAYSVGRSNSFNGYLDVLIMKFSPMNIETSAEVDWNNIYDLLFSKKEVFHIPPINSQLMEYSFIDSELKLVVAPSSDGFELNVASTTSMVQEALIDGTSHIYATMQTVYPDITTSSLMQMTKTPFVYSQVFPIGENSIYNNIQYDLQKADEITEPILLSPNQSISIKEYINYDSFHPSIYSVKQIHIPSIIYACAMQVGLIASEHNVSQHITNETKLYSYGQEAIIDKNKDLILTNTFDSPVIIDLIYDNTIEPQQLVCKIYSADSLEFTYLKSVIEEHAETYIVKVYRVYANDTGGVLSRQLLEQHTYPIPPKEDPEEEEIIEDKS